MFSLRSELPGVILSITPMSSWYKKKSIKSLNHVDLMVQMLYDYKRSQYSNQPLKISDWEWLPEVSKTGKIW